jgi:parallel beta helix pectate lyase-like protein
VANPQTQKKEKRRLQMNKFRLTINSVAIAVFVFAFASFAQAQATRTWVSGVGDDANPCSRTAPCKTFAGAISKTANGGEIDALDPGGFGAVTITKSITIDGGGGQVASVLVAGTNGIVIQGTGSDVVTLVNLRLQGLLGNGSNSGNAGINGIRFLAGKELNVINCYIWGFNQNGIDVEPNQANDSSVLVSNTTVKNCNGDGVFIAPVGGGASKVTVDRSVFVDCHNGLQARSGSRVVARNSVFSQNTSDGIFINAVGAGFAQASVWTSMISLNSSNGVQAGNGGNTGSSAIEIAQNQIVLNGGTGALTSGGGGISTFTNNEIVGNGTNGCAGCTPIGPGN